MGVELNQGQREFVAGASKWYRQGYQQRLELTGGAGTGKSTCIYAAIEEIGLQPDEVLFTAPTGKAAQVLTRKGCFTKTIHSTIYNYSMETMLDEEGKPIMKNGRSAKKPTFTLKESLPEKTKLIVVDEGSMVQQNIGIDLESFGIPIIVTGDLQQLPPVSSCEYFLKNPDFRLTEIMRQNEGNPIIHLASLASQGKPIPFGRYGPKCFVIPRELVTDKMMKESDVNLCGRNITRSELNTHIRENILGINKPILTVGEKIICRKNNWNECIDEDIFLINGLSGFVENVYMEDYNGTKFSIDFRPDFTDKVFERISVDYKHLFSPCGTQINGFSAHNKFEFGNAITVHLSQGSQYKNVFFYSERMGTRDFYNRLMYTGITRAEEGLILVKEDER